MTPDETFVDMSSEEFERILARIAELSRDDTTIALEIGETVADTLKDGERRRKPIQEELIPLVESAWRHVDRHPELFDKAKDVVYPDVILTRTASTRHEVPNPKLLIKTLRSLGEGAIVEIKESVSIAVLKAKTGLIDRVRAIAPEAVEIKPMWNYRMAFRPKDTKSEKGGLPSAYTHDAPRVASD
jgi:hypothetical protein